MAAIFFGSTYYLNHNNQAQAFNASSGLSVPKWESFPISYSFTNGEICGDYEMSRIDSAFSMIESQTNGKISFEKVNKNGSIDVVCRTEYYSGDVRGTYESGEGGYAASNNIITNGRVNLYHMGGGKFSGGCLNIPNIEIHEILHVFALEHTNSSDSLMYPVSSAKNCIHDSIDNETINALNEIYHFN